jgi:predicted DNA-binding protein
MATLTNRLQLLLDDERRQRLERESARTGAPISILVRRAIDRTYPSDAAERVAAADRFLALEPMPVDDWAVMKREMRDELSDPER